MEIGNSINLAASNPTGAVFFVFKILIFILSLFYFFYTLIVVRQVFLMTETLVTEVSPVLKILSIAYSALALGVVILFYLKLLS